MGSVRRSLSFKENHDLRGAEGPHTRHRDAADDPPALRRIAVECVLQVLWTELAGPPAVFLRQHLVFHGLRTSSKRPANSHFYGIPTRTRLRRLVTDLERSYPSAAALRRGPAGPLRAPRV